MQGPSYVSSYPPPRSSPFVLTPRADDTALYQDFRTGFSHLLPGRPALGIATLLPADPSADAVIHLQDAPITLRYRLEAPGFAGSSAAELARGTAERIAAWRAHSSGIKVDAANDSWLAAWGAESAAVAAYDVPGDASHAAVAREDLFVLVKQGTVMMTTWTYPRGFVDDPAYATFASIAEATMVWDPLRWEQRGRVWPEHTFLGPGLFGAPNARYDVIMRELSAAPVAAAERARLLSILSGFVSGAGAPWANLLPEQIEQSRRAILSAARNQRLAAFVEGAFEVIRTAHDLRGFAIVLGRALDSRRSFAPAMPTAWRLPAPAQRTAL